ncbi:PREDICTED: HLA class II histocompatibility antigen, DRB1-4 beta chain-like, partial [Galeopterus variegatus]|uniref:HLA class II histocompatibility antigen, DRB1-4 beta chain-like n=1 Tax=Galeopterus variegatus TaxID=482537 RepID=A0ABM0Q2L4_GALVR
MVCLWFPGGSWMAALTVILMVLSPPLALARDTQPRFLEYAKHECHFSNGTERVRFLDRYFFNREEYVRFDSDVGEFRAVTELGRPDAQHWNGQKDFLEQTRAEVDRYCRHNYGVIDSFAVQRRGERGGAARRVFKSSVCRERVDSVSVVGGAREARVGQRNCVRGAQETVSGVGAGAQRQRLTSSPVAAGAGDAGN